MPETTTPPPPQPPAPVRRLERSRQNKMVAGVAGGIAEYANVDPLLVRVLLAVLTVFGGAGILLYAIGWLLLPAADQQYSLAESVLGRGRRGGKVIEALALVVVVCVFAGLAFHGNGSDLGLAVAAVVGGLLIYRHLDSRGVTKSTEDSQPVGESSTTETVPLLSSPVRAPADLATQSMEAVNRAADRLAAEQLAADDRALHGPWPEPTEPTPPPAKPAKRRSLLGAITMSTLIVVLGLLSAIDRFTGADLSPHTYLASALTVVGGGLLIGAFVGRARWLILLGIPLSIAVLAASLVPWHDHGAVGARDSRPTTVSDIQRQYTVNAGVEHLDLTGVDFAGQHVKTAVHVGAGKIEVTVPRDVDVTVHASAGAGQLDIFGAEDGGNVKQTVHEAGPDGPGGGTLDLTADVGLGQVEVHRGA